jgi:eukaryotic-like serine/threonine-protein kinase
MNSRLLTRELKPPGGSGTRSTGLPSDLLSRSASRLRTLALLYAFTFFMAGYFPVLLFSDDRTQFFSRFLLWGPGAIAIVIALVVAAIVGFARLPSPTIMKIGLVFEVVTSYGIAAAEYAVVPSTDWRTQTGGLSWVAVWVLLCAIVIPSRPRVTVVTALVAVTAVPLTVAVAIATDPAAFRPGWLQFFFAMVFPYLLVVVMAYVGARVIYSLGTEVTRARELGSYRLVERLGVGGMGEVWRAEHRFLARPAAIKLIRSSEAGGGPGGASDSARRRFEREAQVIASLRSPHTVNLFDFGVASDGAFYYVMELLEGLDADTLVRRTGPLPSERVIHVLRQVCHSLSEAESRGLVHRDIKPANIFLCRYGEDCDFVKVLDFGIAKTTTGFLHEGPTLTRELTVHGTPAFIAPEQVTGANDVDGRADIYAVGCVAYWLLTGQLVFAGDSAMSFLLHHASTPPAPPSSRTELPIPRALDDLVLACLAKDPAGRPQTARELSNRLMSIEGAGSWTEERAKAWWSSSGC